MVANAEPLTGSRPVPRVLRWLGTRVLLGVLTLFLVSVLIFLATEALPGEVARIVLGTNATPEKLAAVRVQLGLDQPLIAQYWHWLHGVLTGDLGTSLINHYPVGELLAGRLLNSLVLGVFALVLILPLSLLTGMLAARLRDRFYDRALLGSSMIANALPEFVIGTVLAALFGTTLFHVLPPVALIPPGDLPWWHPADLVLPIAAMVIMGVAYLSRLVRVAFLDVLQSEYIQQAVLNGLSTRRILFRHALPNALAPITPAASLVAAYSLAGLIVVENVFSYPGIGTALVDAVGNHDLPIVQAIVLFMAAAFYVLNTLADVLANRTRRRR
ncbi:ABC transporter permease [Sciscionella sediminilitoris]|uniref:ABC transporter permease n=1 Tax=Sciscionella sediminilitoris TaxID=1445613 RepID=UPI000690930F|nr:ABC transporter permease [Sciscionella sp. SE31]